MYEIDDETETAQERCVHIPFAVGSENGNAIKLLHALQEIVDLDISKAIVGIFHLRALSEECIGFIKEKQDIGPLACIEDQLQPLLSLTNIFAHDTGQVYTVEIHA